MLTRALTLLSLLLLASVLGAQSTPRLADYPKPEPPPGEPRCGKCETTGRLAAPLDLDKWDLDFEREDTWAVLYDSELIESDGHGIDWVPCPRCKTPTLQARAQADYDKQVKRLTDWLAERRRRVDEPLQFETPLWHVETTHFVIASDIPKLVTADKKTYRGHEIPLLYAIRMERLYKRFYGTFGLSDRNNMSGKHHIYMFEDEVDFRNAAPRYTGLIGTRSVSRMAGQDQESALVTWWAKSEWPKDDDFFTHLTHMIIHHFTSDLYDVKNWFPPGELGLMPPWLNDKYGWLDAGLAHWFEFQQPGSVVTYCMREQDVMARWGGFDWRKNIYKAVKDRDVPSFTSTLSRPTPALTAKEHQFVWSWVDFLMDRDASQMGLAIKLAKQEAPTRDILSQCWGLTTLSFEEAWSSWVMERYAPNKY